MGNAWHVIVEAGRRFRESRFLCHYDHGTFRLLDSAEPHYPPPNSPNVDNPGTRSPHTHHITMTDAVLSYDTSVCPANIPATTVLGFVVTGPVSITGNGSPAPFETKGPSTLQVCINGGTVVQFSNVTLVLTGPAATGHFGGQPIHGVVRIVRSSDKGDPGKK
jgi:hypothetical protein